MRPHLDFYFHIMLAVRLGVLSGVLIQMVQSIDLIVQEEKE